MKKIFMTTMLLIATISASAQTRQLFDFGWQFTHRSASPLGSSKNGTTQTVDLPHDWDIFEGPNSGKGATGTGGGWFDAGKGEYRKQFRLESGEIRDKLVKLHFEGVYQKAEVYVNGQHAGQHHYGYTPFTVDVTPYLYKDKRENEVVVEVDNSEQPNCRWYSGSGIYRHVWLETMPTLHIAENGVFVTTPEVSADKAKVQVEVTLQNEGNNDQQGIVEVEGQQQEVSLKAGESKAVTFTYTINNPKLWSPESPNLYEVHTKLSSHFSPLTSHLSTKFGVRSFSFDAENGFVLNGKKVLINGACVHHDDGVLGAMAFDDAEIRKVRQMKEAGFNLIRTSHNPTTRAFLDACDSLGMLVIDEAFDGWRTQKNPYDYSTVIDSCFRQDIHAMVLRDRNHPSVISWSIGNEVIERKDIRVVYTARQMKKAILEKDPTRPVTEALCAWDRDWEIYDPHAEVLDVAGYNYMIFKHASDHERDPKRVIWQTESYPRDAFRNWAVANDFPYVVGDIVWTGLDYLGESGIGRNYYKGEREGESWIEGGQPEWHGAPCGDVDITGWRKPISHYREMLWNSVECRTESVELATASNSFARGTAEANSTLYTLHSQLYMAIKEPNGYHGEIHTTMWSVWPTWKSWTWPGWEGKPIEVEVYTKAPEVKLYLNDQLIGTKKVNRSTEFKAVFTVNYEPGTLRAEAVEGPNSSLLTLHSSLLTAGAPAHLRLTPDRTVMTADGQSLTFVTVEVLDKQGTPVPEAAIPCEATVKGAGKLLAFASADLKDTEPYTSPRVKTWKGRALLVVRSTQKGGSVNVTIKSSLPTASLKLKSK
jgi:beta-galactosidase